MNLALARSCNAPVNAEIGADAKEKWKEGKPIRVVRNYKLAKFSEYAPKEGNRYDGIYKVVKYYPDKNTYGFITWKYILKRDDPSPAPWTEEGKARITSLGLKMLYPDGYLETMKTVSKIKRHGVKRHGVKRHGVKRHGVKRHAIKDDGRKDIKKFKPIKRRRINKII